jgi:hypothetical protein
MNKIMHKLLSLAFLLLLFQLHTACNNKKQYDGRIEKEYTWTTLHSFSVTNGYLVKAFINDTSITLSYKNNIVRYNQEGTLVQDTSLTYNGVVYQFVQEDSILWVDIFNGRQHLLKKFSKKNELLLDRKIDELSDVLYVGNNKFIIPGFNKNSNAYRMELYDAYNDTVINFINIGEITNLKDSITNARGTITFTNKFATNKQGQVLAYYRYNSYFLLIDTNLKFSAHQDFRKLPIGEPSYKGHNVLLNPLNCGIDKACIDNKFIYLLTPTYVCKQWNKVKKDRMLDIYSLTTKEYLGSIRFPTIKNKEIVAIENTPNGFVTVYANDKETKIVTYNNDFLSQFIYE